MMRVTGELWNWIHNRELKCATSVRTLRLWSLNGPWRPDPSSFWLLRGATDCAARYSSMSIQCLLQATQRPLTVIPRFLYERRLCLRSDPFGERKDEKQDQPAERPD